MSGCLPTVQLNNKHNISFNTPASPSAPTIASLTNTYSNQCTVTVTWASVPTATSYNVSINDSVNTLDPIPSVGATQYTFTGLTNCFHYHEDTDQPQLLALPWGHRPTPAPCTTMGTQTHPSSLHYQGDTDPHQLLALPWGHRPTPAPCTIMGTQTHPSSLHYHEDTDPPQLLALPWGTQTHPSSLHYHEDTDPPQLLALPWGH